MTEPAAGINEPLHHLSNNSMNDANTANTNTINNTYANNNSPSRKRPRPKNTWESRNGKSRRHSSSNNKNQVEVEEKPKCSVCQQVESPKYKCPKCRATYCSIDCCRNHKNKGCSSTETTSKTAKNNDAQETGNNSIQKTGKARPTSKYLPSEEIDNLQAEIRALQERQQHQQNRGNHHQSKNTEEEGEDEDLEEGWKLTDDMKATLSQSQWLRDELQDVGLQTLLRKIVATPNTIPRHPSLSSSALTKQEVALDHLKADYPSLQAFLDKLLVVTGVLELPQTNEEGDDHLGENDRLERWLRSDEYTVASTGLTLKPIDPSSHQKQLQPTSHDKDEHDKDDSSSDSSSSSEDDDSDDDSSSSNSED